MKRDKAPSWRRLVARASTDPFFLGSALATYKTTHGLADHELAEWLECPPGNLDQLALCRLPAREEQFASDVEQIAEFADCNPDRLVVALREVTALGALRKEGQAVRDSFLLAARDRKEESASDDDG